MTIEKRKWRGGQYSTPVLPFANKIAILGNSIVGQNAPYNGTGLGTWQPLTAYSTGTGVVPNCHNLVGGHKHLKYSSSGGTSGGIEPIWPGAVGGTVNDGNITWTASARTDETGWVSGYWTLAQILSGQRLDEVWIGGLSSKASPAILANLPAALAAGPDIIYFAAMFENESSVYGTTAQILANWNAFVLTADYVRSLGKRVMINTVLPNGWLDGSTVFTGYTAGFGTKTWNWLNAKIREFARLRPDVILFDAASVYTDPNPANPVWPENAVTYLSGAATGQALKKTDGVHPLISGSYLLGKALAAVLREHFPLVPRFPHALDTYALSANPDNGGSAGVLGTGMTSGTVPTHMRMIAAGTVTSAVASIVPRTDTAGNWAQCVYESTAAMNIDYARGTNDWTPGGAFAVGAVVQAFSEIKVLANPVQMWHADVYLDAIGATPQEWASTRPRDQMQQDLGQMITEDTVLTVKTLPFAMPSGATNIRLRSRVYGRGASSITAQFGRMALVPCPIPDIS